MANALLTVDVGNSGAKLRLWSEPARGSARAEHTAAGATAAELVALAPLDALMLQEAGDARLAPFLAAAVRGGARRAALCSVGAPELEGALALALERALGPGSVARPAPGVENDCQDPATTGSDRLFAARGAAVWLAAGAFGPPVQGTSLVLAVDAGTAFTVDALAVGAGRIRFLGGAIAPGPRLLLAALRAGTARLPEVELELGAASPALGRDTRGAIRAGVAVGLRGAARELAQTVWREAVALLGLGSPARALVVTGGARALLLEPEPVFEGAWREDAELVHRGLCAALLGAGDGERDDA